MTDRCKVNHTYHVLKSEQTFNNKEYDNYRYEWYNNPNNDIVNRVPIHLDIEATSRCNLKCIMCPRTEMKNNNTFWKECDFDLELYKKIVDEGSEKGLKSIKFNYLGEPLINKNIVEMIQYAKSKNIIDVMLNTNATLLTEEKSKQLINSGLDKIFFSVDSPNKDTYEKIRINANFDKVIDNIKIFSSIRSQYNKNIPFTRISMVVTKNNYDEVDKFKTLFFPIVDEVAYVDYVEHTNISRSNININSNFKCPQLWQRMFIHPDGYVTVCCVDSKRIIKMGNIKHSTLEDIWTSSEYNKLREYHINGNLNKINICRNCHLASI